MTEQAIVNAITRALKARRAWHFNIWGAGMTRAGLPDIVAVYRGQALAIECKTPTGRVSKRQQYELSKARAAGAITIVARRLEDLTRILDRIDAHLDTGAPLHEEGTP